jgi:carbamoyl-phosphate synthase large subunit
LGFTLYGTHGTAQLLKERGVNVIELHKMRDGQSPNALDEIKSGKIQLVINIPDSRRTRDDAFVIRQQAIRHRLLCVTTVAGVKALVNGLGEARDRAYSVNSLQKIHARA